MEAKMKTKIEFPKVMLIHSWSRSESLGAQRNQQIEVRREFWNSLFKEWGYKEIIWPKESYWDTLTLDGVTIYLNGWAAAKGRCYIRQNSGNEGVWSFFEIDKPVDVEKVKSTVKKIWDAAYAEKVKEDTEKNAIEYNKALLPEGFYEKFANLNIALVVRETYFEVIVNYDYTLIFDLSGNQTSFSANKTFRMYSKKTASDSFDELRKTIAEYETKVYAIEKELVEWFKGVKKA